VLLVCPPVEALREWLERADIKKGRSSGRSTDGTPWRSKALTPQSINLIVKRRCAMVGLELEAFFGARTSRRISDRGGAARDRATGGDAAVPSPVSSTDRELLQ
jgi:hypothetical protein